MIARVFPRRTKMTPTDDNAFVGLPPLGCPVYEEIHVSVTFTWDIPKAHYLATQWLSYGNVRIGGPAIEGSKGEFVPGMYLRNGVVITSRGCPKQCPWCISAQKEGALREIDIKEGWDVQDNNLLACSRKHIEAVFEMLVRQPKPIQLIGGLDIDYLKTWHVDLLKSLRLKSIWVACDELQKLSQLDKAKDLLSDFSFEKRRCYVLIGFNGESIKQAEKRLVAVYEKGFLPLAMLYQPESFIHYNKAWRTLQRNWCRPAIIKATMKG